MTDMVKVESTPAASTANIPPINMQPGYVPPPTTPESVQPTAPEVAPAPTVDLNSAIAALTAALGTPAATPTPVQDTSAEDYNNFDVTTIDDPIIRSMATVLQTVGKGVDMNRALAAAIDRGDPSLVDVAYLREAGGANAEQLITIAKEVVSAIEAKATEVTAKVHTLAGGEGAWNTSAASFNAAAPEELRLVVKQMLDSKQTKLIEAGAKIVVEFGKASGLVPKHAQSVQGGAAAMPSAMALDKFQFQDELRKLNPQDRQFETKRGELFARRQLGKKLGK